ncbi:MAG: hypothetical protein ACC656_11880, partial [Candidatus Heimdallarchaeota archaeon]
MAVNDIRRQLVFEDGGRPYNNRDFESIKNSLDDALQIYNQFLVPNNDKNTWLISGFGTSGSRVGTEGLVWLNGAMRIVDSNTQVNFTTNPSGVYIGIVDEETQESRLYKDGNVKPVFNLYQAKWMTQSERAAAGLVDDEVMYFKNEAAIDTSFFSVSAYTRSLIVLNETETDTVNMTGNIELVGKNGLIIQRVSEGVIEFNQGAVSSYQHPTFKPTWDSVDVVTSGAEVVASIKATEDGDAEGHTVMFTAKKRTLDPTDLSFTTNDKAIRSDSTGNMEASKVSITDDGA